MSKSSILWLIGDKWSLETSLPPNNDIRICLLDRRHSWTESAFWNVNNKKWRKWCKDFHLSYLITRMANLWSQWTPTFQIKYFMFHWSIYRLFVLNTTLKRDSFQMIIFVNDFSTWSTVRIKESFDTSISRIEVSGVSLFHLSYLITLMAYLCLQRASDIQIKYFMFDWWIYRPSLLNTALKRNSVQKMILVNVCSTWSMVNIKDAFWYVSNKKWPKWCKFVSPYTFNNTYGLPVFSMVNKCPNHVFYVSLVNLQTICAKLGLETCLSPNNVIRICLLRMRHSWTKYAFWDVSNKNCRKWCKFV
jgi:hypothetical protein